MITTPPIIEGYKYLGKIQVLSGESGKTAASRYLDGDYAHHLDQIGFGPVNNCDFTFVLDVWENEAEERVEDSHVYINKNFVRRIQYRLKQMGHTPFEAVAPVEDVPDQIFDGESYKDAEAKGLRLKPRRYAPRLRGKLYHKPRQVEETEYSIKGLGAYWNDKNDNVHVNAALLVGEGSPRDVD